jgi:CO/xanthine dehydrogenase FAD-binding subunit
VECFYLGAGMTMLAADELISQVRVPVAAGPQSFAKVGRRRGVVKALCSLAMAVDARRKRVGVGIGALGPPPCRARGAEDLLRVELTRMDLWDSRARLCRELLDQFGQSVALAIEPHTDLLATAAYRRHAIAVLARRSLDDIWQAYRVSEF